MPESIEKRCDAIITNFARCAYRHTLLAGIESALDRTDSAALDTWHQNNRSARQCLAMVMVLRRVRETAPDLLPALVDQINLADLLSEMGLHVQIERYLGEVGGSTEDLTLVHYLAKREAA